MSTPTLSDTAAKSTVTIDVLTVYRGHKSITIEDDGPAKRAELAGHVEAMIRDGFSIFLEKQGGETVRVTGYNKDTNEWLLGKDEKRKRIKAPASNTKTTAIANTAGG